MMNIDLTYYTEPEMEFGHSQLADDARDGLTLFGPYKTSTGSARIGIIGTQKGISAYEEFSSNINKPVYTQSLGRPFFPGFQTVFGLDWPKAPVATINLDEDQISEILNIKNLHERTYAVVSLYLNEIKKYIQTEESQVDLWYIIIPSQIRSLCRPKSKSADPSISKRWVKLYKSGQRSVFEELDDEVESYIKMYESDSDFHNQFKARVLAEKLQTPVQVVLEDTLLLKSKGKDNETYSDDMKAHLLWTLSTSTYYKLGYLPWKLANVRKGVCYIGLVFKTLQDHQARKGFACCAAQMFLDTGDGMVFRGNNGPWRSKDDKTYHLNETSSEELIKVAIDSYFESVGEYPKELFIHGRTQFTDEEWSGFNKAIAKCPETNLVGVTINELDGLRLFKDNYSESCKYGIMRGMAMIIDNNNGYLWTKGYIPKTETSNHLEVARPLRINISRGECHIDTVMRDILCLTKLNYNACIYGDGLPVTLRFSDKIGNILTALKDTEWPVKQFKYYI